MRTKPYLRLMPGRIVGRSIDVDGKEAYCLTLSTREQHIRRHRATSNICTNETLIALMGAMHMALLGPDGLRDLAHRNMMSCQKAKEILGATPGVRIVHDAHHFNEFAIEVQGSPLRAWITWTATGSSEAWTSAAGTKERPTSCSSPPPTKPRCERLSPSQLNWRCGLSTGR